MQSTAGFQGLMAVAVVAMEMAMMAFVVPGVRGAPVRLDQDLSGAGEEGAGPGDGQVCSWTSLTVMRTLFYSQT